MKPLALVIENDAGTRKLLDVLLSRIGMDVDGIASGDDAFVVLQHVRYDVLIVDLLLPGRNGMELLEWLAATRPEMLGRAVVISSVAPKQLEAVRERWPAVRTIRKPFELGEVLELTQSIAATREPRVQTAEEKFCRFSMRAGAKAGVVVAANAIAHEPLLSFGYSREMLAGFFPIPADAPYPLCTAIREEKPLWIASLVAAAPDYPMLAPVFEKNASRALAAVPLRDGERVVGAAGWSFREPRLFSEPEQQVLIGIANSIREWLDLRGAAAATRLS
ncbi:MAG TPA: response regulator [Thermoanaerobaculia bacterium]|jgi:CheY-like chemotaxis protein|nr:response regulator [Thermoanaerobaculia bacterium]